MTLDRRDADTLIRTNQFTSGASELRDTKILVDMVEKVIEGDTVGAIEIIFVENFISPNELGGESSLLAGQRISAAVADAQTKQNRRDW